MHKPWSDLIPFYVAGTLTPAESLALERHLATCPICQGELDEWRVVSKAVQAEAGQWARGLPPISSNILARLQPIQPASVEESPEQYTPPYHHEETRKAPAPSIQKWQHRPILTLAAAVLIITILGALVLVTFNPSPQNSHQTEVALVTSLTPGIDDLGMGSGLTPGGFGAPFPTQNDLGILPVASPTPPANQQDFSISPTPTPTLQPPPGATPIAQFAGFIGGGYTLMTTETVGNLASGTRVRISHAWYDGISWIYFVVAPDETHSAEVRESQLTYASDTNSANPTPFAGWNAWIGSPYVMRTTTDIGTIPAGSLIRITGGHYDGEQWIYSITTEDQTQSAEALESQLKPPSDFIPGMVTPTTVFDSAFRNNNLWAALTEPVNTFPVGTQVQITYAYFDGFTWIYGLTTTDGQSLEARETQISLLPITSTPAPTSIPTTLAGTLTPTTGQTCMPTYYHSENCPLPVQRGSISAAFQPFERGFMVWRGDTGAVIVLVGDGRVLNYPESSYIGYPDNPVTDSPPVGRVKPISGFGRVWGNVETVRNLLGWGLETEQGYSMTLQYTTDPVLTSYFYI
ncbi:MAG: zf-HC2 domain-containing protein, partial [Anaerolineae bacterium]|nr:zf-HC2 domain-containing protein [Anaerolineae bacterium]